MPKIGSIFVPEEIWIELIKFLVLDLQRAILEDLRDHSTLTSDVENERKYAQMLSEQYDSLEERITSLIRDQIDRDNADFRPIELSSEYEAVWLAAHDVADQFAFDAIFDYERLSNLADNHIRKL